MHRILIFGNSGSGKSTMARALARELNIPHLDLDSLAWNTPGQRKPMEDSARLIDGFIKSNRGWIAEGCYADLIELMAPHATEMRFLNPRVDACIANARRRPWEPGKYPSKEEQDRMLEFLIGWIRDYDTRTDEYSLARHRALFNAFAGIKHEYRNDASDGL
jgi:adenylate kinase family enzyme